MHAFDVLGDPVRRRILELLASGEQTSGAITATIRAEFGISQPAVSQHLKVLRDNGFATVRAEGVRRLYAVDPTALSEVDQWLDRFRGFWSQRMDALETELFRGARARRREREGEGGEDHEAGRRRHQARQRSAAATPARVDARARKRTTRSPDVREQTAQQQQEETA